MLPHLIVIALFPTTWIVRATIASQFRTNEQKNSNVFIIRVIIWRRERPTFR
jgi:hypothetical protein